MVYTLGKEAEQSTGPSGEVHQFEYALDSGNCLVSFASACLLKGFSLTVSLVCFEEHFLFPLSHKDGDSSA